MGYDDSEWDDTLTCDAFNVRRGGMCDGLLAPNGDCPDAIEHGCSHCRNPNGCTCT